MIGQSPETKNGHPTFYAPTIKEWRAWLAKNGKTEKSVWLIIYHKESKTPSVTYAESIEHSLCYGWIDSLANKRDSESFYLFFTPRKPKSNWSKVNKERIERMTREGYMNPAGQELIDLAKQDGSWDKFADAEAGIIPDDLQALFDKNPTAFQNFQAFTDSVKRLTLEWIITAKRPETRLTRIEKTVELAEKGLKVR